MHITNDTWVVLWCPQQRQFHHETLEDMLKTNGELYLKDTPVSYMLLAFARDGEHADAISADFRSRKRAFKTSKGIAIAPEEEE